MKTRSFRTLLVAAAMLGAALFSTSAMAWDDWTSWPGSVFRADKTPIASMEYGYFPLFGGYTAPVPTMGSPAYKTVWAPLARQDVSGTSQAKVWIDFDNALGRPEGRDCWFFSTRPDGDSWNQDKAHWAMFEDDMKSIILSESEIYDYGSYLVECELGSSSGSHLSRLKRVELYEWY